MLRLYFLLNVTKFCFSLQYLPLVSAGKRRPSLFLRRENSVAAAFPDAPSPAPRAVDSLPGAATVLACGLFIGPCAYPCAAAALP